MPIGSEVPEKEHHLRDPAWTKLMTFAVKLKTHLKRMCLQCKELNEVAGKRRICIILKEQFKLEKLVSSTIRLQVKAA